MEREREVIQSLNPADVHRMAELVLAGWSFSLNTITVSGTGYGWRAEHRGHPTRYAQTLQSLIGYVNNFYLDDNAFDRERRA